MTYSDNIMYGFGWGFDKGVYVDKRDDKPTLKIEKGYYGNAEDPKRYEVIAEFVSEAAADEYIEFIETYLKREEYIRLEEAKARSGNDNRPEGELDKKADGIVLLSIICTIAAVAYAAAALLGWL